MSYKKSGKLCRAAAQAEMDEKTARKYLILRKLPSEIKPERTWRTRQDQFADDWPEIEKLMSDSPGLQAKTIFAWFQRMDPGKYQDGQLRSLQRRIKHWRATAGPSKEVMFPQDHIPGRLGASDFTRMKILGITIAGQEFDHLLFHFVLTYSNWETITVCFSESFESLSEGLQNALWKLGGVPQAHRTDQLSSAVQQELAGKQEFTSKYMGLMNHYGILPEKIRAGEAHENGDVEKSHDLIKNAVDQELMLRGSRDFSSRADYESFLGGLISRRNAGRSDRFAQEQAELKPLPARRLESITKVRVRVSASSTIRVAHNVYSVSSRLIGEIVEVRLGAETLSVMYGGRCVESNICRLRGENGYRIDYRHVIESLVRKPGAFAAYRWREELYPTSRFRVAYDVLQHSHGPRACKEYLRILELAALESEIAVDEVLRYLLDAELPLDFATVKSLVLAQAIPAKPRESRVDAVDLNGYDILIGALS